MTISPTTGWPPSAAATAADMFAPGSGAAVQIASQEIQRAIQIRHPGRRYRCRRVDGNVPAHRCQRPRKQQLDHPYRGRIRGCATPNPQRRREIRHHRFDAAAANPIHDGHADAAGLLGAGLRSGTRTSGPQVTNHITINSNGAANDPTAGDLADHLTRQYQNLPSVAR
jgi:hypothetical protein